MRTSVRTGGRGRSIGYGVGGWIAAFKPHIAFAALHAACANLMASSDFSEPAALIIKYSTASFVLSFIGF